MFRYACFVAGLCILHWSATFVRADEPGTKVYEVAVETDIAYRNDKDSDAVKHKLDVYTPKGQKDFPVMMFVHGGSWKSGNKGLYAALGRTFASNGIGTVIINYRLSTKDNLVRHPDHIKDVAAAFAWVHGNIGKFGGKSDRLFISGHSAGGHLVALLATDEQFLKEHKLSAQHIRGVMALSGVYEIQPLMTVFTDAFGKDAEICKAASPINHVQGKTTPFLICYADKDLPTCDKMAESFCKKLTDNKCDANILQIKERTHISIIVQLATSVADPCTQAMMEFVARHSEWKKP